MTASDLAAAMSIQRSSFYNSFGSREAAFREALSAYAVQAPDAALEQVRPGQAVVPVLVSVLREVSRIRASDPEARGCLVCNSVVELVGVVEGVGPLLADAMSQRVGLLERLLAQAVRQGELATLPDVRAAAQAFVAFLTPG